MDFLPDELLEIILCDNWETFHASLRICKKFCALLRDDKLEKFVCEGRWIFKFSLHKYIAARNTYRKLNHGEAKVLDDDGNIVEYYNYYKNLLDGISIGYSYGPLNIIWIESYKYGLAHGLHIKQIFNNYGNECSFEICVAFLGKFIYICKYYINLPQDIQWYVPLEKYKGNY